jgi:hypothetical protein
MNRHAIPGLAILIVIASLSAGCMGPGEPECPILTWEGFPITITRMDGSTEERHVYPSPRGLDADEDGLDDCQEFAYGTDPNDPDTTGNGLLDGEHVVLRSTDDLAQTWIERGIVYHEREDGRLVFQGSVSWSLDPTKEDTFGTGISDGEEVRGFPVWILGEERIVRTDPRAIDTSNDGLSDRLKRDLGLDPSLRDTDGDGIGDHNDVNPWLGFRVRLEVLGLNVSQGTTAWVLLQLSGAPFQSAPTALQSGSNNGSAFSSPVLDHSDGGGDILNGRHNVTFAVTFLRQGGSLDLFSATTGSSSLIGAIHALTGDLYYAAPGQSGQPGTAWPESARFSGADGDVTLRVVPEWPAAWQSCIDAGCRHGAGDFLWR